MARKLSSGSIIALVFLAIIAGWFVYVQYFNDERAIRRRMNEVAAALSTSREGTDLARLARVMKLRQYLADDATAIDEGSIELRSRDEILAVAAQWATGGEGLTVDFVDLTVSMAPDGATAQSRFTARGDGTGSGRRARTGPRTAR